MKKNFKRLLSIFLSAAMLIPAAGAQGVPDWVGKNLRNYEAPLHDGLYYSSNTAQHNSAGRVEERILVREAGSRALPVVVGGDYIYNSNITLKQAADKLTASGKTVMGGITGDMFTVSTGVALGLTVTDGIVRSSCDAGYWAAGFRADGSAIVGDVGMKTTLTAGDKVINIDRINRVRDVDRITLYTPDFSTDTRTTKQGRHVVLTVDGDLSIGGTVSGTVKAVIDGANAEALRKGEMVLSASSAAQVELLGTLTVGEEISISITAYQVWNDVMYACGGVHALVKNGSVMSGLGTDKGPRTAVGMKADGSLVLFAVDGRQSGYSAGMSLTDVAYRMQSLGCTYALELDGGGSTSIGIVNPGKTDFSVVNSPSDGSLRKCTNYIFLVNPEPKLGQPEHGFVYGPSGVFLSGASARLEYKETDANWHAIQARVPQWSVSDSALGRVDSTGFFTAGAAGDGVVTAEASGVAGEFPIKITDTIDTLKVYSEADGSEVKALQNGPGKSVALRAEGTLGSFKVISQDDCFKWEVFGDVGTVDANGTFTFGDKAGAVGHLSVSGGDKVITIPVTVGTAPVLVEGFENGAPAVDAQGDGMTFKQDISIKAAGRGMRSGLFEYQFTPVKGAVTPELTIGASIALNGSPTRLNLLLRGDGSGNALDVLFANSSGAVTRVEAGKMWGTEYASVQLEIPAGSVKICGFALRPTGSKVTGSFHLDHLVTAWNERGSLSAPTIELSGPDSESQPGNLIFSATITDSNGAAPPRSGVSVTWDGNTEEFTYDVYTGRLSVTVPDPVSDLHILTVTATDVFGNRGKASIQIKRERADNLDKFIDVGGKWMEMYADFLDGRGLLPEREEGGLRYFDPDKQLTRLEMIEMVIGLMKADVSLYANTVLPFTDAAKIPEKSLPAVKAAYALGVVAGIADKNGSLSLGWNQPITRQDFCVIVLGAVPKGYERKPLEFTDKGNISPYALEAVETFVNLGAISGMGDGTFMPRKSITRAEASAMLTKLFF